MADGNVWQKKIAKLAVERLGPADEVGVIDGLGNEWHIPLQEIGDNRAKLLAQLDKLEPGDMPDFDPALAMARLALNKDDNDPQRSWRPSTSSSSATATRWQTDRQLLAHDAGRTRSPCTTVGVATHGQPEDQKMPAIAKATGGNYLQGDEPQPSCRPSTSRNRGWSASRSSTQEVPANCWSSAAGRRRGCPTTTRCPTSTASSAPRPSRRRWSKSPSSTPKSADQEFPLLAYWHYGLGKAVAFTSDAGKPENWSKDVGRATGGHLRQVLGAGRRLVAAADGERPAAT